MPITRNNRYQEGSIDRVKRSKGSDVWVYRWRELGSNGHRVQRKQVIGDADRYRTKSEAKKAVDSLRAEINARQQRIGTKTVREAWGHFQLNELRDPEVNRSQTTIDNYLTLFKAHIIPKWGDTPLDEVESVAVERWLRSLTRVCPSGKKQAVTKKASPLAVF